MEGKSVSLWLRGQPHWEEVIPPLTTLFPNAPLYLQLGGCRRTLKTLICCNQKHPEHTGLALAPQFLTLCWPDLLFLDAGGWLLDLESKNDCHIHFSPPFHSSDVPGHF